MAPGSTPVPGFAGAAWAVVRIGEADAAFLSASERTLYESFDAPGRRQEWLAGRAAAHAALDGVSAPPRSVLRNAEGAPQLVGPGTEDAQVAITHGKHHAAAIAAPKDNGGLGIDWVDANDRSRLKRIAHRVLHEDERHWAAEEAAPSALLAAWGAREAIAKATRTGMFVYALNHVRLTDYDGATGEASVNIPGTLVRFWERSNGDLVVVARVEQRAVEAAQAVAAEVRSSRP